VTPVPFLKQDREIEINTHLKKLCVMLGDELANYHFGEQHLFGPKRLKRS